MLKAHGTLVYPLLTSGALMAFTEIDQFKQLLDQKKHWLVVFAPHAANDVIASAAALASWLHHQGYRATVVSPDFALSDNLQFLKSARTFQSGIGQLQKFIITVDIGRTGVQELSYDVKDNQLRVFVTPKNGMIVRDDVRATQSDYAYDGIICVGAPDLASLGPIVTNNPDFFAHTPIVNLDHQATNEHFGQLNFVDLTMSTTAELIYRLLQKMGAQHIGADVATALLTGLVAGTNSFKKPNVRPATLAAASELVGLGADRMYIVKNLFETKSVATFKLWGAALSHLEQDMASGVVWTVLTREDFARTGARDTDLVALIDELIANVPTARAVALVHEHETGEAIHAIVQLTRPGNALELLAAFHPHGDKTTVHLQLASEPGLHASAEKLVAHLKDNLREQK